MEGQMSLKTNPGATTKIDLKNGFRYLVRNAYRDFVDALALGRELREGAISPDEFEQAVRRRFPAESEIRPNP